jgi:peptide/nickel transport system ATP-binding protein
LECRSREAQRLALARILLLDPAVIVADELTSRLDPIVQKETIGLMRELVDERQMSLVLISHAEALATAVADEVVRLG